MQRDDVLRILREHADELTSMHVSFLALFGSVAREETGPESDIDLLVEFDRTVGLFHFIGVQQRLEEILGRKVDLVERGAVHPALRDSIDGEAIRAA
jgi:uncharacterized protein